MKLNYKRTILIGLAFLSISAFWQMYDNVVPLILKTTFGLGETVTGAIMAMDNVLALFLLPLFGAFSDKVSTPIGKRMPFVLVGTTLAVLLLMFLGVAQRTGNFTLFVGSLFFLLLAMGLYRSPAVALMPDLTPKQLRSKGNAIINLMGAIGGVCTLLLIKAMVGAGENPDYMPLFLSVAMLMAVAVAILFCTIRENKLRAEFERLYGDQAEETSGTNGDSGAQKAVAAPVPTGKLPKEVKRSLIFMLMSIALWFTAYNAVTSAFSRYATVVWGLENGKYADCLMVATVAAIISYIPIGIIAEKVGRKRSIQLGILLMAFCFLVAGLYPTYHVSMNVWFAIIGFAWASIGVNSLPMVVEISSAADVGKYTGYYYTFSMSAQVITPILSGVLLEHVSYRTLFPYAVTFSLLSFCTMTMVKHGDSKPQKKKSALESFDIDD